MSALPTRRVLARERLADSASIDLMRGFNGQRERIQPHATCPRQWQVANAPCVQCTLTEAKRLRNSETADAWPDELDNGSSGMIQRSDPLALMMNMKSE